MRSIAVASENSAMTVAAPSRSGCGVGPTVKSGRSRPRTSRPNCRWKAESALTQLLGYSAHTPTATAITEKIQTAASRPRVCAATPVRSRSISMNLAKPESSGEPLFSAQRPWRGAERYRSGAGEEVPALTRRSRHPLERRAVEWTVSVHVEDAKAGFATEQVVDLAVARAVGDPGESVLECD